MAKHIPRVYVGSSLAAGIELELPEAAVHHLAVVMRAHAGDPVVLFNGTSEEFPAELLTVSRQKIVVSVVSARATGTESPRHLTAGLAILKRDAMTSAVSRLVETGITQIVPIVCDNTTLSRQQISKGLPGWQKTAQQAAEQSGRLCVPVIEAPRSLQDFLRSDEADLRLLAHTQGNAMNALPASLSDQAAISFLTGPEGGWSEVEVTQSIAAGVMPVALGPRILRADTAPAVLCGLLQERFGDFA